jgi:tight adherence protein C
LTGLLPSEIGALGPAIALGAAAFVLIATALVALRRHKDPFGRLDRRPDPEPAAGKLRAEKAEPGLVRFAGFLEPQDAEELSAMRLTLLRAGYRSPGAVQTFHAIQLVLALGLLGTGLAYALWAQAAGQALGLRGIVLYVLGPGVLGYVAPKLAVARRIKARREEITRGFPDALDMLLVCIEAGQSLDQAIVRVARELHAFYPSLAHEFETVAQQVKAGKDKALVLKEMGERVDLRDVSSLVTVLVQSQSFGTSVGEALRVYAGEMRDKRVMRAEEKANTLPVKMTLATMMLTIPPLLAILVGPSIYEVMRALGEGFGGR